MTNVPVQFSIKGLDDAVKAFNKFSNSLRKEVERFLPRVTVLIEAIAAAGFTFDPENEEMVKRIMADYQRRLKRIEGRKVYLRRYRRRGERMKKR